MKCFVTGSNFIGISISSMTFWSPSWLPLAAWRSNAALRSFATHSGQFTNAFVKKFFHKSVANYDRKVLVRGLYRHPFRSVRPSKYRVPDNLESSKKAIISYHLASVPQALRWPWRRLRQSFGGIPVLILRTWRDFFSALELLI